MKNPDKSSGSVPGSGTGVVPITMTENCAVPIVSVQCPECCSTSVKEIGPPDIIPVRENWVKRFSAGLSVCVSAKPRTSARTKPVARSLCDSGLLHEFLPVAFKECDRASAPRLQLKPCKLLHPSRGKFPAGISTVRTNAFLASNVAAKFKHGGFLKLCEAFYARQRESFCFYLHGRNYSHRVGPHASSSSQGRIAKQAFVTLTFGFASSASAICSERLSQGSED